MKKLILILLSIMITILFSSCESKSSKNIHELINTLNSEYNYQMKEEKFTVIKDENTVYRTMTDNKTLLSLYCNKNNEIIQCTLSSFDTESTNNIKLLLNIGMVLTGFSEKTFKTILKNTETVGRYDYQGWTLVTERNNIGITYILNRTADEINNNQKPTLKNFIESR